MLGRLDMNIDECISAYSELMQTVFGDKANSIPVDWSGNIKPQYDSRKLKAAVDHVIKRTGLEPDDPMNDGKPRRCRVFVCATAKENRIFRFNVKQGLQDVRMTDFQKRSIRHMTICTILPRKSGFEIVSCTLVIDLRQCRRFGYVDGRYSGVESCWAQTLPSSE